MNFGKPQALCFLFMAALVVACMLWQGPLLAAQDEPKTVEFNRHIRPILSDNCFTCHGPDGKQRQANLRLDTREGIFADRGGYHIIAAGEPSHSRLFQRISAADKAVRMPPPWSERELTKPQVELIRQWIEQGAKWQRHWSFILPKRPPLPKVKGEAWPRNPIDHFILVRLEREGLKPSPQADKATLIRRVTYDLTGLPPTPAEVEAFLADNSPGPYEKVVDRLLKSPGYGERMAMEWLDLARYADTHGYHIDSHRDMWYWRDWVIDAYNRNLPFDQFTIEQLAGDLLPNATLEQKIATGFNRNHMINFEGGAIPEEYQTEYVVNRVNTTSTVWMGLTMGCARCHDHKYDPIKQREFYQFYAFFNNIPEKGLDGRKGNAEPYIQVPSPRQRQQLDQLTHRIAAAKEAMPGSELETLQAQWEKTALANLPSAPRAGLLAHYELDGHIADTSGHYRHGWAARGEVSYEEGRIGAAAKFDGDSHVDLGQTAEFERTDQFSLGAWIKPTGKKEMAVIAKMDSSSGFRGYGLSFGDAEVLPDIEMGSHLFVRLIHRWPDNAIEIRTKQLLLLRSWHHVAVTYDGSSAASGLNVYVDGELQEVEVTQDSLTGSIKTPEPLYIGKKNTGKPFKGVIDDLRIYHHQLTPIQVEQVAIHHPIRAILARGPDRRADKQKDELRDDYLTYHAPPRFRDLHRLLKSLRREKDELDRSIPTVMVMQEMDEPRETFMLIRGDYRSHGEKVTPGVPACLPPLLKDAPANRLGLARWLVDPSHPLTARVAVNRYWQKYFGSGIVNIPEDFGSQGESPSHPDLLDWLATEFIRTGWNTKAMQRLIVSSATYRQSSRIKPELWEKDPQNRLLARASRLRLPAEIIRDSALAISGLLNGEIGGPSVFPYQPAGLWTEVSYGDRYSAQVYMLSQGKALYRRSMYTFWKRTVPPPSFSTFDAPDRETCTVKRTRTNTPLQALVLMNDPTYVEAARVLAQRMMTEVGEDHAERISFAFRLATARKPAPAELEVLLGMFQQQLTDYRHDRDAALKLLGVGGFEYDEQLDRSELAAWTTVASTILNLDETITRE